jgi:hypothetical protein
MRANTTEGTVPKYTDYVYLGHDPLCERLKSGSTKVTTDYVYVNGRLAFTIVGANTNYYIKDALGSFRQIWQYGTSASATFSVQTYKPFGTAVTTTGTEKFRYAGEQLNSSTNPT